MDNPIVTSRVHIYYDVTILCFYVHFVHFAKAVYKNSPEIMGCTFAKTIEFEGKPKRGRLRALFGRDHRRTKVQTIHIRDPVGVPVSKGTPMMNLTRKTEQTVLMQLREEGIIPNKGSGGVSFTIDMKEELSRSSTLHEDNYYQLPGVPQCSRDITTTLPSRPLKLPPITTRNFPKKSPLDQRESDVEMLKNEVLRRKGKMARISERRRELAEAKREARERERRARLEEKMKTELQKDDETDRITVNDRLQRAKINRELKEEERRTRTEAKLARVSTAEKNNKVSTEERLERAREKRENRLREQREKWERKERKIEEIKRSRRVNTPAVSQPNMEV